MIEYKKNKTLLTIQKVEETNNTVIIYNKMNNFRELFDFSIDYWETSNNDNKKLNPEGKLKLCKDRPFGVFYKKNFDNVDMPGVNYYSIFAISKKHILQMPKEKYQELIEYVDDYHNTECAHYLERITLVMFGHIPDECLIDG